MTSFRRILALLLRRRTDWASMDYGKPAKVEDTPARMNGER